MTDVEVVERVLDATLPDDVRAFYRRGVQPQPGWPLWPLSVDELADLRRIFDDPTNPFDPAPDARYLFTDDNSNWAGVFVSGPFRGKWLLLDHDEPEWAPRFFNLERFIVALNEAASRGVGFEAMRTDYPLGNDAPAEILTEAATHTTRTLQQLKNADTWRALRLSVGQAFSMLPPGRGDLLDQALSQPGDLLSAQLSGDELARRATRVAAAAVIERQRVKTALPTLERSLTEARDTGDFPLWSALLRALGALEPEANAALATERRLKPAHWPWPRQLRLVK